MVRAEGRRSGASPSQSYVDGIDDDALHRRRGVVARLGGGVAVVAVRDDDAAAVRVEQDLGRIEAHAARGIGRPVDAIAVELSRPSRPGRTRASSGTCGWSTGSMRITRAGCGVVVPVEEQQLDARGVPREQAEVHAAASGTVAPSGERLVARVRTRGSEGLASDPRSRTVRLTAPGTASRPRSRPRTRRWCGRWRTSRSWRRSGWPCASMRPGRAYSSSSRRSASRYDLRSARCM